MTDRILRVNHAGEHERRSMQPQKQALTGSTVWADSQGNLITIGFEGWHEEFDNPEEALTLRILLSEVIDSDDSKIRRTLENVLVSLSAVKIREEVVGPVGSQVIITEIYKISDDIVTVTEDTYIGIELSGPRRLALKVFGRVCGDISS